MSLEGDMSCIKCGTIVQTLPDLLSHRRDGKCHLPEYDANGRIPFSRKKEVVLRMEKERNKQLKLRLYNDIHEEK